MSDIEDEFRAWFDAGALPTDDVMVTAERDGVVEQWDAAMFNADVRRVATEFLDFAMKLRRSGKGGDLVTVQAIAEQPPLYAEAVIEAAIILLSRYGLHGAPELLVGYLMDAITWLIRIARQRGIVPYPPAI